MSSFPPQNPYLMGGSVYPCVHWDSTASDSTPLRVWRSDRVVDESEVDWIPSTPHNMGMGHRPYEDGEEAVLFSGSGCVGKIRITGGAFELIDRLLIPGFEQQFAPEDEVRSVVAGVHDAGTDDATILARLHEFLDPRGVAKENVPNGVYVMLDRDGNYFAGFGTTIYKVADESPGDARSPLKIVASYDLRDGLLPEEAAQISRLLGLAMTYDGHIAVAMPGIVAILDRELSSMEYVMLPDEAIDNGVTVDPGGGVFVVTSKYMRRLDWNGSRLSVDEADGAWAEPYDYVPNPKAFSRGAGNTPTLMGFGDNAHRLVIIADAGEPVKIVAMWRDQIPDDFTGVEGATSRRVAGQLPIRFNPAATIEFSPHVNGYGTMMMASAWDEPALGPDGFDYYGTLFTAGVSRRAPRGSEKFTWHPETYTLMSDWVTDFPSQVALHPVSAESNTVTLCAIENGVYSLVVLDWDTGQQVGTVTLGSNPIFNANGGFFIPLDNGDLYVTGGFGPVRIRGASAQ